ncbi:MAG TPA: PQQ-dependent sugar dehydrogenase [Gemmatimonadaceae bacterium]|nr:PQQ-dependent sugar dehydrogenase [Gemmatimonadaceae bacterium]
MSARQLRRILQPASGGVAAAVLAAACATSSPMPPADQSVGETTSPTVTPPAAQPSCGTAGLTLPAGFCATIFADSVGSARHLVVAPNGDVFVAIQRGRANTFAATIRPGALALRDTNGDGIADIRERFADTGNTGIGLHGGWLYLDVGTAIVRYPLPTGALTPSGPPETVVGGIPGPPGHRARNFVIASDGSLFVNVGSATNSCQVQERQRESPGHDPCLELQTRAGIWRFDANQNGQLFTPGARYAAGIRNATGLAIHPATGSLYAATHGRDLLHGNWPDLFTEAQNAELPAEELFLVNAGDDFGWPYCYWDGVQQLRVLAPEYGGNGREVGRCASRKGNVSALPAHWAPNALTFYNGTMFPARYHGGGFIAFHGSWNRAPLQQEGYNVVFIPFAGGTTSGAWETFADGFADPNPQPTTARHRPTGVAVAPDGALFVSDDVGGRIWRITYRGP